ncbi:hypothetical protein [Arthrobacter sp. H35-D1]|uniref:hypothetical protein n=1 Tax=Arthrobacter sp. H35-D1 TaxID=3046202 RepID=UPI0024B9A3B5|nr:hypothetical protein [Arthrobacter sp. H35-D1]MDJ0315509.1 hypothetical protein [Arthrobacter sp. H35-D1]
MTIATEIRTNTGYARTDQEAHAHMRQVFNKPADIDPPSRLPNHHPAQPTTAETQAIAELCNHLNSTQTRYPETESIRRYKINNNS